MLCVVNIFSSKVYKVCEQREYNNNRGSNSWLLFYGLLNNFLQNCFFFFFKFVIKLWFLEFSIFHVIFYFSRTTHLGGLWKSNKFPEIMFSSFLRHGYPKKYSKPNLQLIWYTCRVLDAIRRYSTSWNLSSIFFKWVSLAIPERLTSTICWEEYYSIVSVFFHCDMYL